MPRFVISEAVIDTSCLRCLLHLDFSLDFDIFRALSLRYNKVLIPRHVWREASRKGRSRLRLQRLLQDYSFLKKCSVTNAVRCQLLYDCKLSPDAALNQGEAEAIIQASEREVSDILIDERKGRLMAQRHSLNVKGILGLLVDFKRMGFIPDVKPLIEKLKRDIDFRIGEEILNQALEEIGE